MWIVSRQSTSKALRESIDYDGTSSIMVVLNEVTISLSTTGLVGNCEGRQQFCCSYSCVVSSLAPYQFSHRIFYSVPYSCHFKYKTRVARLFTFLLAQDFPRILLQMAAVELVLTN